MVVWSQYSQSTPSISHTSFSPKSIFNPTQSKGPYLSTFYQVVYKELTSLCLSESSRSHHSMNNLSPSEHSALKSLSSNSDIIIKQADKGGGIVLQNREHYLREASRLLSYSSTYEKLTKDPLPKFIEESNLSGTGPERWYPEQT